MENQEENKYEGWPTTRRFPRTSDDAFRHLGDGMDWWTDHERSTATINDIILYVLTLLVFVLLSWMFK